VILILAAAFTVSPARPVQGQVTAVESTRLLKPADGFEATLWASEPQVLNPTSIDIDSRGRIWVAEGLNYRLHRDANGQFKRVDHADAIKVMEDIDGDGRADRVTVFAEDIYPVPMGLAIEEIWKDDQYQGCRLYVGNSPDLLVLEDTDGDDRADKRYALLTGFGGINSDHGVHGMMLALDGKLYFTHGDGCCSVQDDGKSEKTVNFDVVDKSGRRVKTDQLGSTLRVNLDGTQFEVLADRHRNPYETCVSSFGQVFTSDNDDDGNRGSRMLWILDGGNYGYRTPGSRRHWGEEVPGIMPKLAGTGNGSPVGILVYEGELFPAEYRGAVLQIDAGTHHVNFHPLTRKGAGYRTEYKVLLDSDDNWYRPIDAAVAPDGSLYVVDWYDAGVGGHRFVDQNTGRIHRVVPKGAKPEAETVDFASVVGLIRALQSPVVATRFVARQHLVARAPEAIDEVRKLFKTAEPMIRARALHVLAGMGDLGRSDVVVALKDRDPRIRELALKTLARDVSHFAVAEPEAAQTAPVAAQSVLGEILPLVADPDAGVRRELILALREVETTKVNDALRDLALAWDGQDRHYLEALVLALRAREDACLDSIFAALATHATEDPAFAYRPMAEPPYFPITTNDAFLRPGDEMPAGNPVGRLIGLAWALQWDGALPHLEGLLAKADSPALIRNVEKAVNRLDANAAALFFAKRFFDWDDPVRQRDMLDIIGRKLENQKDSAFQGDDVAKVINQSLESEDLVESAIQAVGRIKAGRYADKLMTMVEDEAQPVSIRAAAMEALGQLRHQPLEPRVRKLVNDAKGADRVTRMTLAALTALVALESDDDEALEQLQTIIVDEDHAQEFRRTAMRAMARRAKGGTYLLNLASQKKIPDSLWNELIVLTHNHPDRQVRRRAGQEVKLPESAQGKALPPVAELLSRVGDAAHGEAVFFRKGETTAACGSCHRVQGRGQWIGPDLSTIGTKYGKDGLLESILNPSGAVGYNYLTQIVELNDGRLLDGLMAEETSDRLALKNAQGERFEINKSDIKDRRSGTQSLMPDGLAQAMSEQDLVDVLAYLASLNRPVATAAEYHVLGPVPVASANDFFDPKQIPDVGATLSGQGGKRLAWRGYSAGQDGLLNLSNVIGTRAGQAAFCYLPIDSPIVQMAEVVFDADLEISLWVNGKSAKLPKPQADIGGGARALIQLIEGENHLVIRVDAGHENPFIATTVIADAPTRFSFGSQAAGRADAR
jgi:putative membrane-bound dehydrogenase-like protein